MAYYISDGTGATALLCRAGSRTSVSTRRAIPDEIVAWTGDFDTGIEGHGTL